MAKKLFITGTGTDVGKTYVSGLIAKCLQDAGVNNAYYKAAMSGNPVDKKGKIIPMDAKTVKNMSGIKQGIQEMCPYIYEHAYSPHLASRIEGNPVDLSIVKEHFDEVCDQYDYVTMEGSGGILCPLEYGSKKVWLWEMIKELNLSCVLVANAGLGTINEVGLTCYYMKEHDIPVKGIIYNHYHEGDVMEEDNIRMCEELTGVATLAVIKEDAQDLEIDIEQLLTLYEE